MVVMPALPADLIVLERGWLSSNNLICLGEAAAIIDTGHVKHGNETLARVRQHLGEQPLARIAHTHLHSDHCGGTGVLQSAYPSAQTWVPEPTLPHVQQWDEDELTFGDTAQRCDRFTAQHALVPGTTVSLGQRDWDIHAAPGHDALAVLIHEPSSGVLMAGDALWEHNVGVIFPHIDGTAGFEPFLETLAFIERLQPAAVVPGHGAPFFRENGGVEAALKRARQRIEYFIEHPTQHALYAAKVLVKYQFLDVERMTLPDFHRWFDKATALRQLHQQHRPDLPWQEWRALVMEPLLSKSVLRQTETEILDGV